MLGDNNKDKDRDISVPLVGKKLKIYLKADGSLGL